MRNGVAVERPREEWEIREDARVLARAEEIKADKDRMRDAQQMARQLADEEIKRMSGLMKVAGKKQPKQSTGNTAGNPFNKRDYKNPATIGRL